MNKALNGMFGLVELSRPLCLIRFARNNQDIVARNSTEKHG